MVIVYCHTYEAMTLCNFCGQRESRNHPFDEAYVCNTCCKNKTNYMMDGEDDITYIDARNNKIIINSDTELEIINTPIREKISTPIDTTDFKDALLASLYTQVEFLKNQIEEKDLLIRTLVIKENDIYTHDTDIRKP